jgi:hypothetical protein
MELDRPGKFPGLRDRMLKNSQDSARVSHWPGLRCAGQHTATRQPRTIDRVGRFGYRATAWIVAIAGSVIVVLMVATLLIR